MSNGSEKLLDYEYIHFHFDGSRYELKSKDCVEAFNVKTMDEFEAAVKKMGHDYIHAMLGMIGERKDIRK